MGFESHGGEAWNGTSPGGFEFGVVGWVWGPPQPKSITFFLDNTCVVCDQYGRKIRRAVGADGVEVLFADGPPDASQENSVTPRPQFATHMQTIKALEAERIDWLSYEVKYRDKSGAARSQGNLPLAEAKRVQDRLLQQGCNPVVIDRTIACAGWPQLPYEELKKLPPPLPPTPTAELEKILDLKLRQAALRMRAESVAAREKELQAAEVV